MGFISDMFDSEKPVSVNFQTKNSTFVDSVIGEPTWTSFKTVNALFWTGSVADRLVSEKIRADVDGVVAMDYDAAILAIEEDSKVVINSRDYSIIHVENVANQDEVLQIPVKRMQVNA